MHSTSEETRWRLGKRRSEFAEPAGSEVADVSAEGDGAEGVGGVQAVRRAVRDGAAESSESRRRNRVGLGVVVVVVVSAAVGEGAGGTAEGDIERGGDAELEREEGGAAA